MVGDRLVGARLVGSQESLGLDLDGGQRVGAMVGDRLVGSQESLGLDLDGGQWVGASGDALLELLVADKHGDVPDGHAHK